MLEKAVQIGFKRILIIGHIGKLIKLASGSFHTHNRMSDGRMESIVAYAALEGASQAVCEELFNCQTTESTFPILEREGLTGVVPTCCRSCIVIVVSDILLMKQR